MQIVINLQFDSSTAMYNFTGFAQALNNYPPLSYPASALFIVNNVIFIQNVYGIVAFDAASTAAINVDAPISAGTMLSVIYKDSRWFMLQDSALLELKWVNTTGFYLTAAIAAFSSKIYSFVSGGLFDLVYVSGEALVY